MKALEPTPIDVARAKTDIKYFAKEYLEIDLTDSQVQLVETMANGGKIATGMRSMPAQNAADVAIAWVRRRPQSIRVESAIIDV